MRPSPIREDNQPSPTVSSALTSAVAAIASARPVTTARSPALMPSSMMCLASSGVTTTRPASTTVRTRKIPISRRCGLANPSTRRRVPRSIRLCTTLRSDRRLRQVAPPPCMPIPDTFCLLLSSTQEPRELAEPAGLRLTFEAALLLEAPVRSPQQQRLGLAHRPGRRSGQGTHQVLDGRVELSDGYGGQREPDVHGLGRAHHP